jgi:hypothetical protein
MRISNHTREHYIPKTSGVVKIVDEVAGVEAYKWEVIVGGVSRPFAMIFGGKRSKPDSYYYYPSEEARDRAISEAIDRGRKDADSKADRRAKRRLARQIGHGLEIGDLLKGSWGYEQTTVELWKVVNVRGALIEIQRVMCDTQEVQYSQYDVRPTASRETFGDILVRRPYVDEHGVNVKLHGCCTLCRGSWEDTYHETRYA